MTDASSLTGRLLVAMPGIGDPRFEHAVILICAHGPDHAMGLRIDRPAPGVDLKTVLDKLDAPAPEDSVGRVVLMGLSNVNGASCCTPTTGARATTPCPSATAWP